MKNYILLFIVVFSLLFSSCSRSLEGTYISNYETLSLEKSSKLKVNVASIFRANPGFVIKIDDKVVSPLITARYPYPGGGFNTSGNSLGEFLLAKNGTSSVKLVIPAKGTSADSILLYETSIKLSDNKYYTLHISDTANIKNLLVEEKLNSYFVGSPTFRFVNLMPNVASLDLYFGPTLVATGIKYMQSSPEFTVDLTQTSTAWAIRETGTSSSSTALATYTNASTLNINRKYTAFAMGYKGITSTSDPRRPFVSFFYTK